MTSAVTVPHGRVIDQPVDQHIFRHKVLFAKTCRFAIIRISGEQRLERIPSFARGMVVKGIEKFAQERGIALIDEAVVKKSREEMITKRGAMFPFLKKFINTEQG